MAGDTMHWIILVLLIIDLVATIGLYRGYGGRRVP